MAAYCSVYDSRHLQADCQEPGSDPEPYARATFTFFIITKSSFFASFFQRRMYYHSLDHLFVTNTVASTDMSI